jgi:signal transduction histidine kinase/DNA-binding response OmpR family regulator
VLSLFAGAIGLVLTFVYFQVSYDAHVNKHVLQSTLWSVFFILTVIGGVAAWLFVLAHESRRVAEEETRRQTDLLMREIEAHKRTDAKLQKAKELAEAASSAKSRHVAGLSHELRTPLNAILGYAQILERDAAIPTHRSDAIRVVRRNAEHLSGLIDGLLDISKIEAGRFQLNRNEVRLGEFLDQLVDMFRLQAQAKGLAFHFSKPDSLPTTVRTDESRLRQILINLLSNAIKFTDVGHVSLRVRYRSQVAEFLVEDTGIGIHADDVERIFQPFERARSARARAATTGTGLGLTITKLLTEILGGEITLQSVPGTGATFRIKLFLPEVASPRALPGVDDRIFGYQGPRHTVLVADDDSVHRELISELLGSLGFDVIVAETGAECMALAATHKPSLVLLDVGMPDMDGWDIAQSLRRAGPDSLAIVMVSALTPDKSREAESGRLHDGYLMKPLHLRQLLEQIHLLLDIEWTYSDVPERPPSALASMAGIDIPPRELDELRRLGEIGHVRGIEAKLDELIALAPHHALLFAQLRTLATSFDLRGFNAALSVDSRDHG